jgi:hypothetical protein
MKNHDYSIIQTWSKMTTPRLRGVLSGMCAVKNVWNN